MVQIIGKKRKLEKVQENDIGQNKVEPKEDKSEVNVYWRSQENTGSREWEGGAKENTRPKIPETS